MTDRRIEISTPHSEKPVSGVLMDSSEALLKPHVTVLFCAARDCIAALKGQVEELRLPGWEEIVPDSRRPNAATITVFSDESTLDSTGIELSGNPEEILRMVAEKALEIAHRALEQRPSVADVGITVQFDLDEPGQEETLNES